MQQPYAHFKQTLHTSFPNTSPPPLCIHWPIIHMPVWVGGLLKWQWFTLIPTRCKAFLSLIKQRQKAFDIHHEKIWRNIMFSSEFRYFTFSLYESNPVFHTVLHISASRQINIIVCLGCQNTDSNYYLFSKGRKHYKMLCCPTGSLMRQIGRESEWESRQGCWWLWVWGLIVHPEAVLHAGTYGSSYVLINTCGQSETEETPTGPEAFKDTCTDLHHLYPPSSFSLCFTL